MPDAENIAAPELQPNERDVAHDQPSEPETEREEDADEPDEPQP